MPRLSFLRCCTYVSSLVSIARAFSVTVGTPTQCDDLSVSWTGGQAPFQILVTPFSPSQALRNISVPSSAYSNGEGSYSISQFPFKNGTQFLLTMSDATGFGSGGTSTILTVGAPIANNNCNTTVLSPDFFFSTPLVLQQCNNYLFDEYVGATLPATITVLIPGGEHTVLSPVTGPNYTWVVDVEAGTSLVFFMLDSQGRQGGVSPLSTVQPLSNSSCLNVNSPSSTASAPSQTSQGSSGDTTATVGVIAGAVVGGVIFLALLIILGIWCIRKASRRSSHKDGVHDINLDSLSKYQTSYGSYVPLMQHESQSPHVTPFIQHLRQTSYPDSSAGSSSTSSVTRLLSDQTALRNTFPHQTLPIVLAPPIHPADASPSSFTFDDVSSSPPAQPSRPNGKRGRPSDGQMAAIAGQAAPNPPPQIIVHTDLEDVPAPPPVIELPPQYTERRPLPSQRGLR